MDIEHGIATSFTSDSANLEAVKWYSVRERRFAHMAITENVRDAPWPGQKLQTFKKISPDRAKKLCVLAIASRQSHKTS